MFELGGMHVHSIEVSEGEQYLRFIFYGRFSRIYTCVADCCSETWFADIINPEALLSGESILGVEILPTSILDVGENERSRQEVDSVYGYRLKTSKGETDIIFRNSSNGYYGGSINFIETPEELSRIIKGNRWKQITTDWRA